jgi:hypothetical protein
MYCYRIKELCIEFVIETSLNTIVWCKEILKNGYEVYGESKLSILYSNYTTGWRIRGSGHSRDKGFTLFIGVSTYYGPT